MAHWRLLATLCGLQLLPSSGACCAALNTHVLQCIECCCAASCLQDVLLQALESGREPQAADLQQQGRSLSAGRDADFAALAALLGDEALSDASLTPEQLQRLSSHLQQQHHEECTAALDSDEGSVFDEAAEAMVFTEEEEGMAFEPSAAHESCDCSGSHSKQHYEQLLSSPLWRCQEETAQLQLYHVIFLLMTWKMDYVVRDAAFIALLGILCQFLLPKVG